MSESVALKRVRARAEAYDAKLDARKFFDKWVTVIMEDGSVFTWHGAFVMRHKDPDDASEWNDWIIVYTEHYGVHVLNDSDVYDVVEFKRSGARRRLPCP